MLLRRLYHERLAQAGYLIACQASREAIVGSRLAFGAVSRAAGFTDVASVDGGFTAWVKAGNVPATGA